MPIQIGAKGATIEGVSYPPHTYIDWLAANQEATAVQGGDAFYVPTRRLTTAQVAAASASRAGAGSEIAIRSATRRPIVGVGIYTGTTYRQRVVCGFRPDWVLVKDQAGVTYALWRHPATWRGRQPYLGQAAGHASSAMIQMTDDGFIVDSGADANTAATVYGYVAIADNGSGKLICGSYVGNGVDGRVLDRMIDGAPAFVMFKRDNTYNCWTRATGMDQAYPLNGGAPSATVISSLDPVTISSANDVNQASTAVGNGAEGMDFVAFMPCDAWTVQQYTGTGVDPTTLDVHGVSEEDSMAMLLVKGHSNTTGHQNAHVVLPHLSPSVSFAANGTAVGGLQINKVTGSTVELDDGTAANELNATYTLFAIKVAPESRQPVRKTHPAYVGRPGLRCGVGGGILTQYAAPIAAGAAWTMEWMGSVRAGSTDDVLWAIASATGVRSAALRVSSAFQQLLFDQYHSAADAFELGTVPARGAPVHLVLRSDGGSGSKRDLMLTLNGRFHKEFGRDRAVTTPADTKTSFLCCRDAADALAGSAVGSVFSLARFYARRLTNAEVAARYERVFGLSDAADVADFAEEWDAANASGTALLATVESAHDGVISSCTGVVF